MSELPVHSSRVVSGVQPSGALHLGNYLGALRKFVDVQDRHEAFLFVADLHAITQWQDPARLADQTREIAAAYLAAGLDPRRATIFPPSPPCAAMRSWPGSSTASRGWAGSTA